MKRLLILFLGLLFALHSVYANEIINQEEFQNKTIYINVNSYKILQFNKRIKNIQLTNSENIHATFIDNKENPLSTLKVFAKNIGNENAVVTFQDNSVITISINIVQNLNSVIQVINNLYPDLKITQINESIVLEGKVRNNSDKQKIIDVFSKSGYDKDKNIIDLIQDQDSSRMVRVKLYVVQIDNNQGQQLINRWKIGGFNDGKTVIDSVDSFTTSDTLPATFTDTFLDATSLTGGITSVASRLGSNFNVDWTLNYLKKNNAVRIMNESTLIMQENKESVFNAGGVIFVKVSTTTAEGVPTTELREVKYGLNISMNVNKLINDKYIDFMASAKSDELDWQNAIDGLPGLKGNNVTTNVIIEDGATIVLAGALTTDTSKNEEKIPLLGDIPIIGNLFKSSVDSDYHTDLVFFITPEIVDPRNNNQRDTLNKKIGVIKKKDYTLQQDNKSEVKQQNNSVQNTAVIEKNTPTIKKEPTQEELHKQRVKEILGY